MRKYFFTSDTHFGHKNIIDHCSRPFSYVEEMNQFLIKSWNSVVTNDSTVFHLGDFAFKDHESIFNQLNGRKVLVKGNHDGKQTCRLPWDAIDDKIEYEIDGRLIVMFHYPIAVWNKKHYDSIHLHGHCHGNFISDDPNSLRFDVGVDTYKYTPISFDELIKEVDKRIISRGANEANSLDHHVRIRPSKTRRIG